ncbi:MAG: dihydroneopterin aldolase [Deltaproteobacteria bacterium]|nr:dihydroneopterin aldolase [Deltaproteobacteria bacterium]
MISRIFVSGLELSAYLGVYPHEQGTTQTIELYLEVETDDSQPPNGADCLDRTVDYDRIADTARSVVGARHFKLVETLAESIARRLLQLPATIAARVRVEKLDCVGGARSAGAEVVFHRTDVFCEVIDDEIPTVDTLSTDRSLLIIGGGVAGLTAAIWAHRLGHRALVVDPGPLLGGQLLAVHRSMPDIPAMPPLTGQQYRRRLLAHFVRSAGQHLPGRVISARCDSQPLVELEVPAGRVALRPSALLICSGLRRRQLRVAGEQEFFGRGILASASVDTFRFKDRRIVVIGGGDAALENALILADAGAKVTLCYRRAEPSARPQFATAVAQHPRITTEACCRVLGFDGAAELERVRIDRQGEQAMLACDGALVRIGWLPNSEFACESWRDAGGFLPVGPGFTVGNSTAVFAAGDITGPGYMSVVGSAGMAASATRAACRYLDAHATAEPPTP